MILHKYRQDSEYTEKIFTSKKIWLSTPAKLNDPFEASFIPLDDESRRVKINEMKQAQFFGFLVSAKKGLVDGQFFGLKKYEISALLDRIGGLRNFDDAYDAYAGFMKDRTGSKPSDSEKVFSLLKDQIAAVGIFSLSELSDNSLMWAHYADEHRGICIGFEVADRSALADSEHLLPVTYTNSIPGMSGDFKSQMTFSFNQHGGLQATNQISFSDSALQKAISTKSHEWEYEREWRYVEPISGNFDWPGPIVEITFGLNCSPERRQHYMKLVVDYVPNDVRFYEIRIKHQARSFERVRLEYMPKKFNPIDVVGDIHKAGNLLESGRYMEALPLLEKLLANNQESSELWRMKGIALGWSGNPLGALECFDQAISLQPDLSSAWYQKGVALTELKRFDEGIEAYSEAQRLGLNDPSVPFNLGSLFLAVGKIEEALVSLKLAQRFGHPRAGEKIKVIEKNIR